MARNDDNPRRLKLTPADVRAIREKLLEIADAYKTLIGVVEKAGVKSFVIDGRTSLDNSLKTCRSYVGKIEAGVRKAQAEAEE